jgi:dihydrolipoamide dehydrogenase
MNTRSVDVAVIGAGTAGLNARREIEKAGLRPVMIESGPYGTTCARVGCMPSKLLIAAADTAHTIAGAERFGVRVPKGFEVDGPAVLERVRRERDRFVDLTIRGAVESLPEEQRIRGHARFVGPTTLEVDGHLRVEARAVVVAAGSTPNVPPPFDAIREHVDVNDDVFEWQDLPSSIAVVGLGIIGLELGQALARLGVRVAFFGRSERLGSFSDPEVARVTREVFSEELDLRLGVQVLAAEKRTDGIAIRWSDADASEHTETFERVLVSAGRTPNLSGLDLAASGLALDARGMPPWDARTTQCADAPIFLAGDASDHRAILHEAADEGRIAGANAALYPDVTAHVRRAPLAIAFTEPQMAMVGLSHAELDLDTVEVGEVSYADQGRARVMGQNSGLVRLYADRRCCHLVGAEMFGPRVEHMAHLLAWSVQQSVTVQEALSMPFYHPVFEEGLRTVLRDLAAKLKVSGDCRCEDMASAPGC